MSARPSVEQLHIFRRFLEGCERAAMPPPASPAALPPMRPAGLLGSAAVVPSPHRPSLMEIAFSRAPRPQTLGDLLGDEAPPFEAEERLGVDRAARIALLQTWMRRFPAFIWMSRQLSLRAGHEAFTRIQKRRAGDPKFADDLSIFRYWQFALWAVMFVNARLKPQPLAEDRQQAIAAAAKLEELARSTTLLKDAGVSYEESKALLSALEQLKSLSAVKRRKRIDAFAPDRAFVENLSWSALILFGDAPPTMICEVAALKVRNPDKVSITKLISQFKKRAAADSA